MYRRLFSPSFESISHTLNNLFFSTFVYYYAYHLLEFLMKLWVLGNWSQGKTKWQRGFVKLKHCSKILAKFSQIRNIIFVKRPASFGLVRVYVFRIVLEGVDIRSELHIAPIYYPMFGKSWNLKKNGKNIVDEFINELLTPERRIINLRIITCLPDNSMIY